MGERREGSQDGSHVLSVALQVLGAAAGIAALATFVGGATLWLRFQALDLPADRAVAVLPTELLVVVGAHSLIVPVAFGVFALLLLLAIDPMDDGNVRPGFRRWMPLTTFTVLAIALVWLLAAIPMDVELLAIAIGVLIAATMVIGAAARDPHAVRHIGWIAFGVFALYGATLNVVETAAEPEMEPVAALLKAKDRGIAGFFVGETPERLWFVSLPGNADPGDPFADAPLDRVVGVPRSEIRTIATRKPAGVGPDDSGREEAHTLLADLRFTMQERKRDTTVEPVVTNNPELAFAPLVHLHSEEQLWPMSARGFIDNSLLRWSNRGSGCGSVTIAAGASRRDEVPEARAIRYEELGANAPYVHTQDAKCADRPRPIRTIDRTRPFEKKRLTGLPLEQGFFLDLHKDAHEGHHQVDDQGPRSFLRNVPVYADTEFEPKLTPAEQNLLTPAQREKAMRITYWMLYGLSQPPRIESRLAAHEGDWERVSVLLIPREKSYLPVAAGYHHHNEQRHVPWYAVKRVVGDTDTGEDPTHPVVYSAKGSHASYWQAGRFENVFKPTGRRLTVAYDEAISCPRCPQWQTWKIVVPARFRNIIARV
jgi:hypothetical protein